MSSKALPPEQFDDEEVEYSEKEGEEEEETEEDKEEADPIPTQQLAVCSALEEGNQDETAC